MKVRDPIQSQLGHLQKTRQPGPAGGSPTRPRPAARGADRVELSDLAGQMRSAAFADEARHTARLDELRQLIASDRYQVAPEDVAEAILREEIEPWTAK